MYWVTYFMVKQDDGCKEQGWSSGPCEQRKRLDGMRHPALCLEQFHRISSPGFMCWKLHCPVLFLFVKRSLSTIWPVPKRTCKNRVSITKSFPLRHSCWFSWVVPSGSEPTSCHNRCRHCPMEESSWLGVLGSWFLGRLENILGLRHGVMDGFSDRIFCNPIYHFHSPRP